MDIMNINDDKYTRLENFYLKELKEKGGCLSAGHYLRVSDHIYREAEIARQGRQTTRDAGIQIEHMFELMGIL